MVKPLLFLDVDGVLNCFDERYGTWINEGASRVCVPDQAGQKIHILNDYFDIVWATAWFGSAHAAFGEYLKLPHNPWPYLRWNQYKLTEILKYADGRPWAFVDDDIDFELKGLRWDENRMLSSDNHLQRVNPNTGLRWDDVDELIDFAEDMPVAPDETEIIG